MPLSSCDLLLSSEVSLSDGASRALREEEKLRVFILALAIWDVAARVVKCFASIVQAATNVVAAQFFAEQLEEQAQDSAHAALKIAARQEVCRRRCIAWKPPSHSLLLSQHASQLTVSVRLLAVLLESSTLWKW